MGLSRGVALEAQQLDHDLIVDPRAAEPGIRHDVVPPELATDALEKHRGHVRAERLGPAIPLRVGDLRRRHPRRDLIPVEVRGEDDGPEAVENRPARRLGTVGVRRRRRSQSVEAGAVGYRAQH